MKKTSLMVLTLAAALTTVPAALRADVNDETKTVESKESKATEKKDGKAAKAVSADEAAMQKEAKITMDQAKAIALKKAPGKVESGELEREHGKLIYSFDIRTSKRGMTEVNVDAITSKIVAVQHENVAKEAAEKKQEAKEEAAKH